MLATDLGAVRIGEYAVTYSSHESEPSFAPGERVVWAVTSETPRFYGSWAVNTPEAEIDRTVIACYWSQLRPEMLIVPASTYAFVGHDDQLEVVDLATASARASTKLPSFFLTFVCAPDKRRIVVVHELGALGMTFAGEMDWEFDAREIVTDFARRGDDIEFYTEEVRFLVNLATGTSSYTPRPGA